MEKGALGVHSLNFLAGVMPFCSHHSGPNQDGRAMGVSSSDHSIKLSKGKDNFELEAQYKMVM